MALYKNHKKIASNGGITNIMAHEFTNSASDVKKNAASASLGVLDTIVRADHVHPFSDAETFAESERIKANNASYGAIVHQKEIEGVQRELDWNTISLYDVTFSPETVEGLYQYLRANPNHCFSTSLNLRDVDKVSIDRIIPTPIYMGNYINTHIREIRGSGGWIYEIVATSWYPDLIHNMAIGYIVKPNSTTDAVFTGWNYPEKLTNTHKLEDYAQPIIDDANAVNINNSSLTTLEQYIEYFIENYPKVFSADIGYQETSNFKTLVGTPVDFGNYIKAYISPSTISAQAGNYISFEVRAIGKYTGKVAIGYLRRYWAVGNTSNLYSFTGWEYQTGGNVEHLVTIYDKDSTDATINQGLTSGVDFPNDGTANYVDNCLRSKYKGLYLLFSSESTGANLYVRTYVPLIHSENNRFGFVTPYQGDNTLLYWGNGMWTWDRIALYHLRECYQTTTTVSNSTRYKLVKVQGVLK